MAAENYGTFENDTCTNVIVLDPEQTNPDEFAQLIGTQLIHRPEGDTWGIGATLVDGKIIPAEQEVVEVPPLPDDYVAPLSEAERIQQLEDTVDWLLSLNLNTEESA